MFYFNVQAIGELMNYLDSNLLTLNNNLMRANFDRILDSIWVEVLEEIQDVLNKEDPVSLKRKEHLPYWAIHLLEKRKVRSATGRVVITS